MGRLSSSMPFVNQSGLAELPLLTSQKAGNQTAFTQLLMGAYTFNQIQATDPVANVITVPPGTYIFMLECSFTGVNPRFNCESRIIINGVNYDKNASAYIRNASGHTESGLTHIKPITVTSNSTVELQLAGRSGNGTLVTIIAGESKLTIQRTSKWQGLI